MTLPRPLLPALLMLPLAAPLHADTVSTSFEFDDQSGAFTLGESPDSVTFTDGLAMTVGVQELYVTGMFGWMVPDATTAEITFESPAETVSLWLKDSVEADGTLTVLGTEEVVLASVEATSRFVLHEFDAAELGQSIVRVRLENAGAGGFSVIDDFTSCTAEGQQGLEDPIPGPIPTSPVTVSLETVATDLIAPNWGIFAPVTTTVADMLFVTDQTGIVYAIDLATGDKVAFHDVSAQLVELGIGGPDTFDERGLLGLAFHPDYARNGLLYTYQSEPVDGPADFSTIPKGEEADHQSIIAEWSVAEPNTVPDPADPDTLVDPASKRVLLRIDQPQFNHDGGAVNFGPDGMLYVSLGDGGSADDQGVGHSPEGNGQDAGNILGGIVRIDPLGNDAPNGQYGIPADNPFVGDPDKLDELFAFGMRNPFRFSFDTGSPTSPGSGELIVADVGQNDVEEVAVVRSGDNHGWPLKEGSFFFDMNGDGDGFVTDEPPPNLPRDLVDPIAEYDHDEGIAIIGGFVYRGTDVPALVGRYVFGEFAQTFANDGRLFHLDENRDILELQLEGQNAFGLSLLGMGRDRDGEVYALANGTGIPFPDQNGDPTGVVLKLSPTGDPPFEDLGQGKVGQGGLVPQLSGTGTMIPASDNVLELSDAARDAAATIVAGLGLLEAPFKGGTLVPDADLLIPAVTDAAGALSLPFTLPPELGVGVGFVTQVWIEDAAATQGLSASNGLQANVQPR